MNMPATATTGTRMRFAARHRGSEPESERSAPSARTTCGPTTTLLHRGRSAKMFESGMRMVGIPADERARACVRPEKLRGPAEGRERQRVRARRVESRAARARGGTHEGAVSATMTVNLRLRAACLRNASTVFECPIVKMNSLQACVLGSS